METLNETPIKLSGFDILDAAYSEITNLAAAEFIDWDACSNQINQGKTECSRGIANDRVYSGKLKIFLKIETSRKGQEYPIITFNNFKDGTHGVLFNGHRWIKEQQGFDVRIPDQSCHLFQTNVATHSILKKPLIPVNVATLW